jgi:hypothetical protein
MSELTLSELRGPDHADPLLSTAAVAFPAPSRRALHRLIDDTLELPAEFGGGMSNHLPMALHALESLGADEARLDAFASRYLRHFDDAERASMARPFRVPADAGATGDWTRDIGHPEAQDRLRAHFVATLAREGRDPVLHRVLPRLRAGVAAHAFHGPIRVAHAVESGHEGELALALAYWASQATVLPSPDPVPEPDRIDDVDDWLEALDDAWRRLDTPPAVRLPWIQKRVLQATTTRAWRALAGALRTHGRDPQALLQQLALAAARRYVPTRSLTMLHVVTTTRALIVLSRWLAIDDADALAPVLHAVAAASLAATAQGLPVRPAVTPLHWVELLARARESDDDHVVKLVHALWTIESTRGHADGAVAATVAVQGP